LKRKAQTNLADRNLIYADSRLLANGLQLPARSWACIRWNSHSGSYGYILRDSAGRKVIAYTRECLGGRPLGAGRRREFAAAQYSAADPEAD
jgi:hypothetical protein